ncbi:MAG: M3 family metallopeptidase [Trueperaceae bacterium]
MTRPADPSEPNPILSDRFPIPFAEIRPDHVAPAVATVLAEAEAVLRNVASQEPPYRYKDLLGAIDASHARVDRVTGTVANLNAVRQDPDLRAAWTAVLPDLASYGAREAADPDVYRVLQAYARSDDAAALPPDRTRFLEVQLDERRRAGAALDAATRDRVVQLRSELATLGNTFQNNVLDGINAAHVDVRDAERLRGVPEAAVQRARHAAERAGTDGWRFSVHQPSLLAVMEHAEDRDLRREMYQAQQGIGTDDGRDNRDLIPRILHARRTLARLLGYRDWADLQTADRMAGRGDAARDFERDLWARIEPHLRREVDEADAFVRERFALDRLEPWDVRFAFERMRRERFDLDDEALRPWFPLDAVQDGIFALAHELFGIEVRAAELEGAWNDDVATYEAFDASGTRIGAFYTDWHPRADKRSGAWKAALINGGPLRSDAGERAGFAPHLAVVAGNLTPPAGGRPALLTHDEARTVFHEFGHLLHQLASTVEVRSLAGTQVAWDFVELPSQILENWLYEDDALERWARHVDDGRPLPHATRTRLREARTFGAAYHMARQISFGTVDLALHVDFDPDAGGDPIAFGCEVLAPFQIRPESVPEGFLPAFTHVFSGGYSAGYYSYLWSEMLDADAFTRFRASGLFDREVGEAFRSTVLSRGNAEPPDRLIRAFLGRDPDPEALLVRNLGPEAAAAGSAAD